MIKGIGIDMVDIRRFDINHRKFIEKILTKKELFIFDSFQSKVAKLEFLAGRFASKEAYLKANQKGLGEISFQDIEILNCDNGAPYLNDKNALLSISHEKEYAIAIVMIQEKKRGECNEY